VLRFRVPTATPAWTDLVHGRISFPNKDVEDFVVLRSDRTPDLQHGRSCRTTSRWPSRS
jgi:glutamyl/glutaminyl-tRNA synthetase